MMTEEAFYSNNRAVSVGNDYVSLGSITIEAKEATDIILLKGRCSVVKNPSPSNCVISIIIGKTPLDVKCWPSSGRILSGFSEFPLTVMGIDSAPVVGNNTYHLYAIGIPLGTLTNPGQVAGVYLEGLREDRSASYVDRPNP